MGGGRAGRAVAIEVLIRTKAHSFRAHGGPRAAEYVVGLHLWGPESRAKLGELAGIPVQDEDLEWIEKRFTKAKGG